MLLSSPLPPPFEFGQTPLSSGYDFFASPTPSKPRSFQSRLDSVYGPHASHGPITVKKALPPASRPLLVDRSSLNNLSLHDLVKAIDLSTPKKSSDSTNDSTQVQTPHPPVSATTETLIRKDSPKTPCTIPVYFPKANMTVSERIQFEKNSPQHQAHQQRIDEELRSPSPVPIIPEFRGHDAKLVEDEFWGVTAKETRHDDAIYHSNDENSPSPSLSHQQETTHPIPTPLSWLPGAVYEDSDIESVVSRSTFSEEPVPDTADPLVFPYTIEAQLFRSLFNELDDAFQELERRSNESNGPLPIREMFLKLPVFHAPRVFFGLRPDHTSCWKGYIYLNGRYSVLSKLLKGNFSDGFIYGVEIGAIEDASGYGDATLFMGQDRRIYYTSSNGWSDEDDEGYDEYQVHGGFDVREFSTGRVLAL